MAQAKEQLYNEWWLEPGQGDQSMEDDHIEFWTDVVRNVIDTDLTGKKLLDFGCNQGGLLRRIYEEQKFRAAVGVDLAQASVAVANERKGNVPAEYIATADISGLDTDFDAAISTAVIYLIDDLASHARAVYDRLKPGGTYYVTHPDYVTNPRFKKIQEQIDKFAAVKCAQNDINAVIKGLEAPGFTVRVMKMVPKSYISTPIRTNSWYGISPQDQLDLWYNHRYAFKCTKPLS